MSDESVRDAIAHWLPRFLAQGVEYTDFERITRDLPGWDDWLQAWVQNGDSHALAAEEAEAYGRRVTAGQAWLRATLSYHFAKFLWVNDMDRHRHATDRAVTSLRNAHRLLDPTAERVEIPFEGYRLVGNLRRPAGAGKHPVVLLLAGLDSAKEEFFRWENVFLERGMATFSLDGPGQGETLYELPMRHDFEVPARAALDYLERCDDLDPARIGAVGVSLGGYYVLRSALFDERIRAVGSMSGTYDAGPRFDRRPPISQAGFMRYSHSTSLGQAKAVAQRFCLRGMASGIRQPALVLTGKLDRLVPWQELAEMAEEMPSAEWVLFDEGNHVCNNLAHVCRPLVADWMHDRLSAVSGIAGR